MNNDILNTSALNDAPPLADREDRKSVDEETLNYNDDDKQKGGSNNNINNQKN